MTEIRSSILEGDIDKAFKHTTAYYPHVLEDNPEIVFRLKCRKYVEMIRRCSELHTPKSAAAMTSDLYFTKANPNANANGHSNVFDEDMELDDENDNENDSFQTTNTSTGNSLTDEEEQHQQHQQQADDEDDDNEEEEQEAEEEEAGTKPHHHPSDPAKYDQLLQEAMSYGQTLMREYRDEKREYRKTLEHIFSLIAYADAKASVHGHLLDTAGRVQVAEELNSAILGELKFKIIPIPPLD